MLLIKSPSKRTENPKALIHYIISENKKGEKIPRLKMKCEHKKVPN